jgi:hypothetical protein
MSKVNGTIEHWAMSDENVNYLLLGTDGKQKQQSFLAEELLDPENEEWLDRTLDLDDDAESLDEFLGSGGDSNLDPDDPRSKLIEKLKEKSGYNDARDRVMDKLGLDKGKIDDAKNKAAEVLDKVPGADKIKDLKDPREIAKDAIKKEAVKQADSMLVKFFGTSMTELAEAGAAWLWPVTLAIIVIFVVFGLGLAIWGMSLANNPQQAAATPPPPTTTNPPVNSSADRAKIVQTALAEVGTCGYGFEQNEGPPQKYTKYTCGMGGSTRWCAGFVGYVYGKSGVSYPRTCTANDMYNAMTNKRSINSGAVPQPGDAIHKDHHIGIVYKVVGNTLYTIEGNKTACVGVFKYPNYKTSSPWVNFGTPKGLK